MAGLEKTADLRNQLLVEQEVLLRQNLCKSLQRPTPALLRKQSSDNNLEEKLQEQHDLVRRLRQKVSKLVGVLVCLKLYQADYGLKVQADDFDPNYLFMPRLPNYDQMLAELRDKNKELEKRLKHQVTPAGY